MYRYAECTDTCLRPNATFQITHIYTMSFFFFFNTLSSPVYEKFLYRANSTSFYSSHIRATSKYIFFLTLFLFLSILRIYFFRGSFVTIINAVFPSFSVSVKWVSRVAFVSSNHKSRANARILGISVVVRNSNVIFLLQNKVRRSLEQSFFFHFSRIIDGAIRFFFSHTYVTNLRLMIELGITSIKPYGRIVRTI